MTSRLLAANIAGPKSEETVKDKSLVEAVLCKDKILVEAVLCRDKSWVEAVMFKDKS